MVYLCLPRDNTARALQNPWNGCEAEEVTSSQVYASHGSLEIENVIDTPRYEKALTL